MNKYLIGLCALLLVAIYYLAYDAGKKSVAVKAAQTIEKAWKERGKINGEVEGMDSVAVCIAIGGSVSDCEHGLRGIQP